jgi:flagellar assembly protein FliH
MNQALHDILIGAAAKALGGDLSKIIPKTAIKKADPEKFYTDYSLTLGEFYVPGRTRRESASEEQKMAAGLKLMTERLQKENAALRKRVQDERKKAHQTGCQEGLKKGLEEGYAKGKADTQASVAKVQANIASVLKAFEAEKQGVLSRSERKSLEIIFQAVERILRVEAQTRPEVVLNVLKSALAEVAKADAVTVKVNPEEVAAVNEAKNFWLPVNASIEEIKVEEDSRVERGGCVVDSPAGSVDARLSVQLEKIREIFLQCWKEGIGSVT